MQSSKEYRVVKTLESSRGADLCQGEDVNMRKVEGRENPRGIENLVMEVD